MLKILNLDKKQFDKNVLADKSITSKVETHYEGKFLFIKIGTADLNKINLIVHKTLQDAIKEV